MVGVRGTLKPVPWILPLGEVAELSSGLSSKDQSASLGATGTKGTGDRVSETMVSVMSVPGTLTCLVTVLRMSRGPAESRSWWAG